MRSHKNNSFEDALEIIGLTLYGLVMLSLGLLIINLADNFRRSFVTFVTSVLVAIFYTAAFNKSVRKSIYLRKRIEYGTVFMKSGFLIDNRLLNKFVARVVFFLLSLLVIWAGKEVFNANIWGHQFLGTFVIATGVQVFLWCVGIRLEILSNVPNEIGFKKLRPSGNNQTNLLS